MLVKSSFTSVYANETEKKTHMHMCVRTDTHTYL